MLTAKKRNAFKQPLAWIACTSHLLTTTVGATVAPAPVGLLGGKGISAQQQRSFEILERKLQRWFDDSLRYRGRVSNMMGTENEHRSQLELERLQLQQFAEEMLSNPTASAAFEAARAKVEPLVDKLSSVQAFGPEVQLGLVAMVVQSLAQGNTAQARERVVQAKLLHPEAKLAAVFPWTWEKHPARPAVESLWSQVSQVAARSCQLRIENAPQADGLFVNGFAVDGATLMVTPGRTFSFSRKKSLQEEGTVVSSCTGPGSRVVRLDSQPVLAWGWDDARKFALSKISQAYSLQTLLVLDKEQDQFSLYLFTPGLGVDAVPVERPLRSEDIQRGSLPIAWEKLESLLDKHQYESNRMASLKSTLGATSSSLDVSANEPPWYKRPSTWVIAGVIASGIAIAVLASRKEPAVKSHTGFTIALD